MPGTYGPTSWDTWTWEGAVLPAVVPMEDSHVVHTDLEAGSNLTSDIGHGGENAIISDTGGYSAVVQDDGNFVLYSADGEPLWSSGTSGQGAGPYSLMMQPDGNLVRK